MSVHPEFSMIGSKNFIRHLTNNEIGWKASANTQMPWKVERKRMGLKEGEVNLGAEGKGGLRWKADRK